MKYITNLVYTRVLHTFATSDVSVALSVLLKHIFRFFPCMYITAPTGLMLLIFKLKCFLIALLQACLVAEGNFRICKFIIFKIKTRLTLARFKKTEYFIGKTIFKHIADKKETRHQVAYPPYCQHENYQFNPYCHTLSTKPLGISQSFNSPTSSFHKSGPAFRPLAQLRTNL